MTRRTDDDPELPSDLLALLGEVRALPPEGTPPDLAALERSIRRAVDELPYKRPFWRTWLFPVGAVAALAAVLAIVWTLKREPAPIAQPVAMPAPVAIDAAPAPQPEATAPALALYLDGDAVEVTDEVAGELLQDRVPRGADADPSLLPVSDLQWVDETSGDELDAMEKYLDAQLEQRKKT